MKKLRPLCGFTILELLIVVIIIGILATLAIPQYAKSTERAKCSQAEGILKSMHTAQFDYYADNLQYTSAVTDLESYTGAKFFSDGSNDDWAFTTTGGADTFTVTATRKKGPHSGGDINLDQDGVWSGAYPFDDPTNF